MSISGSLTEQISQRLSEVLATPVDVEQSSRIGGGSINDSYRIDTNEGRFFLKTNNADRFPSMFEAEADGLDRLRKADVISIPNVLGYGEDHDTTWLLLNWIESGARGHSYWADFGRKLAKLHRTTADKFGLERDNYIGSLVQRNKHREDWASFFLHERLGPMLKLARDNRKLEAGIAFRFERLFSKLDQLFPHEPPALLHGDLWNGNFMTGPDGKAWLVDPAVYYGHREMDIAMSRLFGGFDNEFYTSYNAEYPLEAGWEERMEICSLYPLLVHVVLFGGSYVHQVDQILRRIV